MIETTGEMLKAIIMLSKSFMLREIIETNSSFEKPSIVFNKEYFLYLFLKLKYPKISY